MATTQVVYAKATSAISSTATNYLAPFFSQGPASAESSVLCYWPSAGTLSNLGIVLSAAPGVGKSYLFTLRINNVDTAVTFTISGSSTTGSDTTHSASVNAGDYVTISCVPSGTPAGSTPTSVLQFTATNAGESASCGGVSMITTTTLFDCPLTSHGTSSSTLANRTIAVAVAGSITGLRYRQASNLSTHNITLTLYKNGVLQDGSGVTVNTALSCTGAASSFSNTFNLPVLPGDTICLTFTSSSAPAVSACWGVVFTATTDGQSHLAGSSAGSVTNASTTTYDAFCPGLSQGWTSTESAILSTIPGSTVTYQLSGWQFYLSAAPGAGTQYVFTMRKGGVSQTPTLTISGTSQTGSDLVNTMTVNLGDQPEVQSAPTGTPATSVPFWSAILTLAAPTVPPLAWAPILKDVTYPGPTTARQMSGDPTSALATGTPAAVILQWLPTYPDVARGPQPIYWYPFAEASAPNVQNFIPEFLRLSQMPVENLDAGFPVLRVSQVALDDLEQYNLTALRLSQVVMEILIPFSCNLTPPLPPIPPQPPQPACVPSFPEDPGGGSGCVEPGLLGTE